MISFPPAALRLLLPAVLFCSCRPPDRVEVTQSREPFRSEPEPDGELTDHQRFAENEVQRMLQWDTPEGWRRTAATEFRHINFSFGPAGTGECYLSLISGSGAGALENFNRWRKQMSLEPITGQQMQELPQKNVLGRPARTIDITGTYDPGSGPMMASGGVPKPGWRMVGSIFEAPGALFTIKMTGPANLVEANLKAYDAFLASVRPGALTAPR